MVVSVDEQLERGGERGRMTTLTGDDQRTLTGQQRQQRVQTARPRRRVLDHRTVQILHTRQPIITTPSSLSASHR